MALTIVVVGTGLMGAQIGVEYALGGHPVVCVARRPEAGEERIRRSFELVESHGLSTSAEIAAARDRLTIVTDLDAVARADLIVESVVEDLESKIDVLRDGATRFPLAILASNTSSLSITALGEGAGAADRVVGTHYWNPPLLMPLVEVVRGERTSDRTIAIVTETLRSFGKRPLLVNKDVPGFIWNRLQLALLREAVWIVEQGVATPETVDESVRDGLARRLRFTGPFETVALGGAETFSRIAANLFPVLSDAQAMNDLSPWLESDPARKDAIRSRRDAGLVEALQRERSEERHG